MDPSQPKQYGLTPPISSTAPTDSELKADEALTAELKRQNNFERAEETERRKATLSSIQGITQEFVREVCRKKGLSPSVVNSAGGKIFTYGSYRLGVYGPGSDIDTLVVVPKHVTREDFFKDFPSILQKLAPPGAIEELTPVPEAYVPIIKLEFSGISIDLIFARLQLSSVPHDLKLKDKSILRGLDEFDTRSLNGTRVTDEILELVPQPKTFRLALRAVKLWAQRRAIYANIMGFPGGVAWAMLVARVCQLYPKAVGSVILGKFFRIIGRWAWPQPVMLKAIEDGPIPDAKVWNPKIRPADRRHLMPIITPAYPSMCATHNITESTKKVILKEMARGGDICDKIMTGTLKWSELFTRHTFFTKDYKYYLSVVASSTNKEAQNVWSGLVESKLRQLIIQLDYQGSIEVAHPFNKGFERVNSCASREEIDKAQVGSLEHQVEDIKTETTDQTNDAKHAAAAQNAAEDLALPDIDKVPEQNGEEKTIVYTTTYYVGIELKQNSSKSLDISAQTAQFKNMCYSWQNYDENLHCVNVVHTRNYDLPADVFDSGETRPTRPQKKKVVKSSDGTAKKRSFDQVEESAPNGVKRRVSSNGIIPIATPT